jgi:hypothetical protein
MKEIKISKESEIEIDYSSYDNVKIEKNSEVYVCINRFLKFQFSEYLENPNFEWRWNDGTSMFGYQNQIFCYGTELSIRRKLKPFPIDFLTPDDCYNFPIKELKKILKERKARKEKDVFNNNANAFSFDLMSSVMMEEIRLAGYTKIERETGYYNRIEVYNIFNQEHRSFTISEVKLKTVIRKQQELDETFPLSLDLYGKSGVATYITTWGNVKKLLPGLLELKN